MKGLKPLKIWLERSVSVAVRDIMITNPLQFELVRQPEDAEVIVIEYDNSGYIKQTIEFKNWPKKCIIVSECDMPTYFLPGCYASNRRCWLSGGRAITIPYLISQKTYSNPFIEDFGNPVSPHYLYSFMGGSTSWVRKKLFKSVDKRNDVYIKVTNHYHHWNNEQTYTEEKVLLQKQYADILNKSSFFLCPRGAGVSTIRLFEVMKAGRVPVIISDKWIPLQGIPWSDVSLFVPEKKLSKIDDIIRCRQAEAEKMGMKARQAWERFCSPEVNSNLLADSIRTIQEKRNEQKENVLRFVFPLIELGQNLQAKFYKMMKYLVLTFYSFSRQEFPYSLNRPIEEQIKKL